jgi:uncharacterized lipoprotein YmbA
MKVKRAMCTAIAACVGAVLWTGCSVVGGPVADSARYYILDTPDYQPTGVEAAGEPVVVGLERVRVARYLEPPGIAVRERDNTIRYAAQHRWAEPLEASLARLLTENLAAEGAVTRVAGFQTQQRTLPELDLHVSVTRAEGVVAGERGARAVFRATWELRAGREAETIATGSVQEDGLPWDGQNYDQLAASLSQGVAVLTRQVAEAIGRRQGDQNSNR